MMDELRPAATIGELDVHMRLSLRHIMDELRNIRAQVDDALKRLATTEQLDREIAAVHKRIDGNSPRSVWRSVTEIAIGVTAVSAALGVLVALFRYMKL